MVQTFQYGTQLSDANDTSSTGATSSPAAGSGAGTGPTVSMTGSDSGEF